MYSYTDDNETRMVIRLNVTIACEHGERCHMSFSAGTFKPPRMNSADYQWLVVQTRVGNIVQSCDPRYRVFFDYLGIFRCLRYIWDYVLTPEQRIPFMVFLGFLQRTELTYLQRFVDEALGTSSLDTPWVNEEGNVTLSQEWTAALLRGRLFDRAAIGTAEEQDDDATGETQAESEVVESDEDEEQIPRIVSKEESKEKRPAIFLKLGHRRALLKPGGGTLEARRAKAAALGMTDDIILAIDPRPSTEEPEDTGTVKSRRKALQPEPAPGPAELAELANLYRQMHGGPSQPTGRPGPAPCLVPQVPPAPSPPVPPGDQLPSGQEIQEAVHAPGPAPVGAFVRPWEAASTRAHLEGPTTPRQPAMADPGPTQPHDLHSAGSTGYASSLTFSPATAFTPVTVSSGAPGPAPPLVSLPLRPIPRRATLPGFGFGGEGVAQLHGPQYGSHLDYPQEIPGPGIYPGPSHTEGYYPAMRSRSRYGPRVRRPSVRWQVSPYRTPESAPVRHRLALMRSRAQGPQTSVDEGFHIQQQAADPWTFITEQQMCHTGYFSQGADLAPAPGMTGTPPRHLELPAHQPVRQEAPEAYGHAFPHMSAPWPLIPEQQSSQDPYVSYGTGSVQTPASASVPPLYVEAPAFTPASPGAPLLPTVTQYHFSQAALEPGTDDEGAEGSDPSELCEAIDLSIHGRPRPGTPERIIVGAGDGQTENGDSTRVVLVSAMVHLGQGAEFPDLEDPPDAE